MSMTRTRKTTIVLLLVAVLLITNILFVAVFHPKTVEASFFDSVKNSKTLKVFGKIAPVFTTVTGVISVAGSLYSGISGAVKASSPGEGAAAFFKGLIGQDDSQHKEVMGELNKIDGKIDAISGQITSINTQIGAIDKELKKAIAMITQVQNDLKEAVDTITVALYQNQITMNNWSALYSEINKYYSTYETVRTTLERYLSEINSAYISYDAYFDEVAKLPNANEIMAVVDKIGFNATKSYEALTPSEKALIDTEVALSGEKKKIITRIDEFNDYMYNKKLNLLFNEVKGPYQTDMYDTVIKFSNDIIGETANMIINQGDTKSSGLGEIFYRLAVMNYSTSDEVHAAYQTFTSRLLYNYLLTAYMCEMALGVKYEYELAHSLSGETDITREYKQQIQDVKLRTDKVITYLEYEYNKCINTYDIDGFEPALGYTLDDYTIYYGNAVNKVNYGIDKTMYEFKKNIDPTSMIVSANNIRIAGNEDYQIKLFYNYKEVQDEYEWKSEDETIATVKRGRVIGLSPGVTKVGVQIGEQFFPLTQVSVSKAFTTYNAGVNNIYTFGDESIKYETLGKGYTHNFSVDSYAKTAKVMIPPSHSIDMQAVLNLTDEDMSRYTLSSSSPYLRLEGNTLYILKETTGVVSAKTKVGGKDIVVQVIIDTNKEESDKVVQVVKDKDLVYKDKTTYIYDLEGLLRWQRDYTEKMKVNKNDYGENVMLMNDIDYEWNTWSMGAYGKVTEIDDTDKIIHTFTFDGNGHTIKNIKIGSHNAMFQDVAGTFKGLTLENITFTDNVSDRQNLHVRYSVLGIMADDTSFTSRFGVLEFVHHPTLIQDVTLAGDITIKVPSYANKVTYSPLLIEGRTPDQPEMDGEGGRSTHHRLIDRANLIIDAGGRDVTINIDYLPEGWLSTDNIFAGSIEVINIIDNDKVTMSVGSNLVTDSFYATSTNTSEQVKDFTPSSKLTKAETNDKNFWIGKGYKEADYDLNPMQLSGLNALPRYRKHHYGTKAQSYELYATTNGFRTIYAVGETCDISGIRIFENNVDVTDQVTVNKLDYSYPGKKDIVFTYGTKTLTIPIYYNILPYLRNVTYASGEYATGEDIVEQVGAGLHTKIKAPMYTRVGYKQIGWHNINNVNEIYLSNKDMIFYDNITLVPLWEAQDVDVTIEKYMEDTQGRYQLIFNDAIKMKADSIYTPDAKFRDWTCVSAPERVKADGTSIIKVYYNLPRYTLTFVYDVDKSDIAVGENAISIEYRQNQAIYSNPANISLKGHWAYDGFVEPLENVKADKTYHIKYKPKDYTVKFYIDGNLYKEITNLGIGDSISVDTPKDIVDDVYVYTFGSWGDTFTGTVNGDASYTGTRERNYREYSISFPDNVKVFTGGLEMKKEASLHYGDVIVVQYDKRDGYELDTIDVKGATCVYTDTYNVMGDVNITCTEKELRYTVNFYNGETLLYTVKDIKHGSPATYVGDDPTKEADQEFSYLFIGWSEDVSKVTKDMDVKAEFIEVYQQYTYTFYDEDGKTILKQVTAECGSTIVAPVATKKADGKYVYTFDKWSPDFVEGSELNSDVSYKATYKATEIVPPTIKEEDKEPPKWDEKEDEDLSIDVNTPDITRVSVDGKIIDESNYSFEGGKVVFTKEFLSTLGKGNHAVVVSNSKGDVDTVITIGGGGPSTATIVLSVVGSVLAVGLIVMAAVLSRRQTRKTKREE